MARFDKYPCPKCGSDNIILASSMWPNEGYWRDTCNDCNYDTGWQGGGLIRFSEFMEKGEDEV
jgi:predicted RNA-binding Zn-ribbon protein involved in translation (DUF1610 family)